jgi:hypothetical protein
VAFLVVVTPRATTMSDSCRSFKSWYTPLRTLAA